MVENEIKKKIYSPFVTGLITGVLIGIGFCIAMVAAAMYFGVK